MSKGVIDVVGYVEKMKRMLNKDTFSGAVLGMIPLSAEFFPEYMGLIVKLFVFTFLTGRIHSIITHIVNWNGSNKYNEILNEKLKTEASIQNDNNQNLVRTQVIERKLKATETRYKIQTELIKVVLKNSNDLGQLNKAIDELDIIEYDMDKIQKEDLENPFKELLLKNPEYISPIVPVPQTVLKTYHNIDIIEETKNEQ